MNNKIYLQIVNTLDFGRIVVSTNLMGNLCVFKFQSLCITQCSSNRNVKQSSQQMPNRHEVGCGSHAMLCWIAFGAKVTFLHNACNYRIRNHYLTQHSNWNCPGKRESTKWKRTIHVLFHFNLHLKKSIIFVFIEKNSHILIMLELVGEDEMNFVSFEILTF